MNIQMGHFKFKLTLHLNYVRISIIQVKVQYCVTLPLHTGSRMGHVAPEDKAGPEEDPWWALQSLPGAACASCSFSDAREAGPVVMCCRLS